MTEDDQPLTWRTWSFAAAVAILVVVAFLAVGYTAR